MDPFSNVDLTLALQSIPGPVILLMQLFSMLGQAEVYLLLLPAVYWLYDPRLGIRLTLITACTSWSNDILKQFFHLPRPYWVSSDVHMLDPDESITFGFPSGHTQIPASFLGMVVYWLRSVRVLIGVVILLAFIGVSRIVLGVHFPADVLGGWLIGLVVLALFIILDKPVSVYVQTLSRNKIIIAAFMVSLLMGGLSSLVRTITDGYILPTGWVGVANHATLSPSLLFSPSVSLITAGMFFGTVAGWACSRGQILILPGKSLQNSIMRYLMGMVILGLIYGVLGVVLHSCQGDACNFISWIRGTALGFWISYGAPWLFMKAGMLQVTEEP